MKKRIIPCVYLKENKLIGGFKDENIISEDPVKYITELSVNGADEIILFDLSEGDLEHEEALLTIRKITKAIDTPVTGAGCVNRLEDVKKLIYAGCKKVALNMAKQSNIDLIEEASKRFSKGRILCCADSFEQVLDNLKLLRENVCCALLLNKLYIDDFEELPVISVINEEKSLEEVLNLPGVYGVSGSILKGYENDFYTLKEELNKKGIDTCVTDVKVPFSSLKCDAAGLVPCICQDAVTGEVLMLAYMNEEAYNATIRTGIMTYYSRSRNELWRKGDTSGSYQYVKSLSLDCDFDTILAKVVQIGNACHTGSYSCFFNELVKNEFDDANPLNVLTDVYNVILDRKDNPKEGSYTNYLFDKGIDKILKKVGEEATEIVIAAKNPEPEESKYEIADFLYHVMVLMALKGITWEDVMNELANR